MLMKKVVLAIAMALFAASGVVVATPVEASTNGLSSSITNLEAFGVALGTRVRWEVPFGAPTDVSFEIISCGPYLMFSPAMVNASRRGCVAEETMRNTKVTSAPFDAFVPCQTSDSYFCVLAVIPIRGNTRGTPVMGASGGIEPNEVNHLSVSLAANGRDRFLSWKAGAVVQQKDDIPDIPQRFEVVRDGVVLAHGITDSEYRDTTCFEPSMCFYSVTTINTGGRSRAVNSRDVRFLQPSWYSMKQLVTPSHASRQAAPTEPVISANRQSVVSRSSVSAMSLSSTVVGASVKDTPTGVTTTRGNARVVVKWKTPKGAKAGYIRSYKVSTVQKPVKTCTYKVPIKGVAANTCVVTGLKNGMSYTFTVTATTTKGSRGTSRPSAAVKPVATALPIVALPVSSIPVVTTIPASERSNSTTPSSGGDETVPTTPSSGGGATAPAAPMNVSALRGNRRAVLSWSSSTSDGGSAVTSYIASAVGDSTKSCTYRVVSSSDNVNSCVVTDLINGTLYTFTVVAKNAIGTSSVSTESNSVMPATVPSAPTEVTGLLGDQRVTVTWNSSEDNSSTVTSYLVTAVEDETKTCTNNVPRAGVKASD